MKFMKTKYIFLVLAFVQLFIVNPVFSFEKEILNSAQFCQSYSDEDLPLVLTLLEYLKFLTVHDEGKMPLSQIKTHLENAKDRLIKSKIVSLKKEGKFCIKGETTHINYNGTRLIVPEYFLASNLINSDYRKTQQTGVDTPYEGCPKTVKDYAQYPVTKLSEDKFCWSFLKKHGGIFKSFTIENCFRAHIASCSFTITVDKKAEDIRTFTMPIQIEGKVTAGGQDSGSIDISNNRLILNFLSEADFAFSTTSPLS